jgi:hypothetical protein
VDRRGQLVFLFLILAQGAHSIEEYVTKLYEVFAPARFVSSLVSNDLAVGFLVFNGALVTFGLWCWAVPVRLDWHAARGLVWFWVILELATASVTLGFSRLVPVDPLILRNSPDVAASGPPRVRGAGAGGAHQCIHR